MSLRLQIVSRHRQSLGERGVKVFGQAGGTIGRSLESDWVLPDGQRFLSSRHASIDFRSGSYYIIDTSTNGVYINESNEPVGRGNPQRLFSGDRIRLGEYEITAEIEDFENTRETLASTHHIDPVDAKQHVEAPDLTGLDLIDAFEITGVGVEMLLEEDEAVTLSPLGYKFKTADELELEPEPKPKPASKSERSPAPAREPDREFDNELPAPSPLSGSSGQSKAKASKSSRRADEPATENRTGDERPRDKRSAVAIDAFFQGAGLTPRRMSPEQSQRLLRQMGQLMREMIVGVIDSLHVRSRQKAQLRQSTTTIQPQENNSLKFSASVEEAFDRLLFQESEQYLEAVDAVRSAFGDIKSHQQMLMTSMQQAVDEYLARLDPDHLEEKFSNGKRGSLMGAANKLKYWDMYRDLYQVLSQQQANEMPQVFIEELARAYEQESARTAPKPKAGSPAKPAVKLKTG